MIYHSVYYITAAVTILATLSVGYGSPNGKLTSNAYTYRSRYNHYEKPRRIRPNNFTGDIRCQVDYVRLSQEHREFEVQAGDWMLKVRYVFLCDGPDVEYHKRPKFALSYEPPGKSHRNVSASLGVPYAKPPINELRFKPPEKPVPPYIQHVWGYRPACPQVFNDEAWKNGIEEMDEDCLYLNIFSPFAASKLDRLYPVMIYIHGGLWESGNAENFPAHMLAASQEVVVVTFNYRLGPLGFLSTGDSFSPGNYGLLDQAMAIEWVTENIREFNGDPTSITLFGSGAGAASAGLYMLSHYGSNVHKIIAQSGSAVAGWATIPDPSFVRNNTVIFANALGCDSRSSEKLIHCLRSRSYEELTSTRIKREVGWVTWAPVIEKDRRGGTTPYLADTPEAILDRGNFDKNFIYMSGVTRDDGAWILLKDRNLSEAGYEVTEEYFSERIKKYMKIYNYTITPSSLYNAIEYLYMPWSNPNNTTMIRQGVVDMLSDSYFIAPNDKMVKLMVKNGITTFMYVLNYTIEAIKKPKWQAIPHEIENILITGAPFMDPRFYPPALGLDNVKWTEADRNMSRFFMEAWANFAKFGNPTPDRRLLNAILWEPMEEKHLKFLSINNTNMTNFMCKDYRQTESNFWNLYITKLVEKVVPTWPPTFDPLEDEVRVYEASLWGVVTAAGLFLFFAVFFFGLFCRASRKRPDLV